MAEVVKHFFPRLVELHNYSAAHSMQQKIYNWETLNRTVRIRSMVDSFQQKNVWRESSLGW